MFMVTIVNQTFHLNSIQLIIKTYDIDHVLGVVTNLHNVLPALQEYDLGAHPPGTKRKQNVNKI